MIKRKDQLLEVLKKEEQLHLTDFLTLQELAILSISSKKYCLLLTPLLSALREDRVPAKKTQKTGKKQKKPKQKEEEISLGEEVEVEVTKVPLHKFRKTVAQGRQWTRIDVLPMQNSYLKSKLQSGAFLFYQDLNSGDLIFVNRSMVDPSLDYNKGGFGQNAVTIYEHYFEEGEGEIDVSSMEVILKRQKELLRKTQARKEEELKKEVVDWGQELDKALKMKKIGVILCFGGSFSFGIFEGGRCVLHRSDKKYVCRKKAGERQFNRDKQSGTSIRSMGSQIRRDQEKRHVINVGEILQEHKKDLAECEVIFLQAPGLNRLFVINQDENLNGLQDRLRSVCLTAKKANFTEIEALHQAITIINIVKLRNQEQKPLKTNK